mmetsp:Transcript_1026/g.2831  ORF Transcript_1026/g.2831 Transcript_1026/m.2831 type:complete len:421 (+) Transcript_1026:435-1697(+)
MELKALDLERVRRRHRRRVRRHATTLSHGAEQRDPVSVAGFCSTRRGPRRSEHVLAQERLRLAKQPGHEPLERAGVLGSALLELVDLPLHPGHLQLQRGPRARLECAHVLHKHPQRPEAQHRVAQQVLKDEVGELLSRVRPLLQQVVQLELRQAEELAPCRRAVRQLRARVTQHVLAEEGAGRADREEYSLVERGACVHGALVEEEEVVAKGALGDEDLACLVDQRLEQGVHLELKLDARIGAVLEGEHRDARRRALEQMVNDFATERGREVREDALLVHGRLARVVVLVVLAHARRELGGHLVPSREVFHLGELGVEVDGVLVNVAEELADGGEHVPEDERADEQRGQRVVSLRVVRRRDVAVANRRQRRERPVDRVEVPNCRRSAHGRAVVIVGEPGLLVLAVGAHKVPKAAEQVHEV